MARITKRSVDGLISEGGKPAFLWDDALSGFAVKALPTGVKRYLVKYRYGSGRAAPQRWLTLGTHGQLTPEQARSLAQQVLAAVARGEDPQRQKLSARGVPTLSDVWRRFADEVMPNLKPQTRYEYENQWKDVLSRLGNLQIDKISRSEVNAVHKGMRDTPYRANRVLALLSRLMNLSEAWEFIPPGMNPCRHVERFKEKPRARYLSQVELGRLGNALREMVIEGSLSNSAANVIRLLLLTGARLNEVLRAEWAWVDTSNCVLALPDSKTGEKPIFLSQAALSVLNDQREISGGIEYIFPGKKPEAPLINLRKPWERVCSRAGLDGVRLHDLRHTAASIAVGQGASLPVIGRLLGHSQAQTTQRYAHVDFDPALRAANSVGDILAQTVLNDLDAFPG